MKPKTYRFILFTLVILLGAVLGYGTSTGNLLLTLLALPSALIILLILKPFVRGVTEDERSYCLAGSAARWAFSVFVVTAAIASNVLIALGVQKVDLTDRYLVVAGTTLSLAVAFIFIVYLVAYLVYSRRS